MLVGFEGTVGGLDSLGAASVAVVAERLSKAWAAMNEPIPFGAFASGDAAQTAGGRTTQMLANAPPVPQMLIPKLLSGPIGRVVGAGVGATQAVGHQIGQVGSGLSAGSIADGEYRQASVVAQQQLLRTSGFINQLVRNYRTRGASRYFDGPSTTGAQSKQIASDGANYIVKKHRPGEELIIAGYSRGGLIAINVCDLVARRGHEIDLLILLDPVDRAGGIGHCNVSAAVKNCILLQRDDNTITWKPYTRQVSLAGWKFAIPDVHLTNSRWNFGRMVTQDDSATLTGGSLTSSVYDATHAAFGGVPWTGDNPGYMTERQDRILAQQMALAMNASVLKYTGGWDPGVKLVMEKTR